MRITSQGGWEDSESSHLGPFLVVQWLTLLPMQRVQVDPLVGRLRSHMPGGQKEELSFVKHIAQGLALVTMWYM